MSPAVIRVLSRMRARQSPTTAAGPARAFWLAALAAALASPAAAADCDCSRRIGLCQASAAFDGDRITFTTHTRECSRVSFSIAGHTTAITIRDGGGSALFPAPGASVSIDGCYVCDVAYGR